MSNLEVVLRVCDNDRFARGAAGSVQAHHLPHRAGEQAEWIGIAQIGLYRKRQFGGIGEGMDVFGGHFPLVHAGTE